MLENFAYRRQLLAGALSAPQVAKLLGTSRQTPHDRVQAKTLLGVMDKGALKFPAWQFDPEGADGVIDGLPEILKALHMSEFAKLSWLMRPNPYLEGLTPVEVLKQGGKDRAIAEALAVGSELVDEGYLVPSTAAPSNSEAEFSYGGSGHVSGASMA